ncbi:MAG: PAS-domain containing protein [Zoogloeaceae bacterium]|jgi:two-component system phosphate regulon sensor histidine kinase PhoR|nr:PAS-domain containing protein [Zoogloeaceae bacterium]
MRKQIFRSMALLSFAGVLLTAFMLFGIVYVYHAWNSQTHIKKEAEAFRHTPYALARGIFERIDPLERRITVIDRDGRVLFDNAADANRMGSHLNRTEVQEALHDSIGESERTSLTLGKSTWYYAVTMDDGHILRISRTADAFFATVHHALPAVAGLLLLLLALCYLVAGQLARRIVAPLNGIDLEANFAPPYDEIAPFVRAIQRQKARAAKQFARLKARTETIRSIMDNMSEGAILLDKDGRILSANPSVLRLLKVHPPVEGQEIVTLLRSAAVLEAIRGALAGKHGEEEIERNHHHYRIYCSPVADGGAVVFFLDITEERQSEKLRREFSANVSHELKTPLTSISGYAEMLVNGLAGDADKPLFARKIKDEAERMIALIEDIMYLSRLDEGHVDERFEDVDLAALASKNMQALAYKAEKAGIELVSPKSGPIIVQANPAMMEEMLFNLIDNAIKYNKPGGSVDIAFAETPEAISASVRDTGIGIPPDAQERVFDRFYRVDPSRSKKTGGTGLGLAIVKHIALVHHAKASLKSEEGVGTTITIAFQK